MSSTNLLKKIKSLSTGYNWSITLLSDGRLVSEDREKIIFYNKENYEPEFIYKPSERLIIVSNFIELSSSTFCYCHNNLGKDLYKIKIIEIIKNDVFKERQSINFKDNISKILKVDKNIFITLSVDKTIKMWELNKKKKTYFLKTKIIINNYIGNDFNNMILLNSKQLIYYSKTYGIKSKHIIIFIDIKKGKNIKTINDIECLTGKNTMLIQKNILIISAVDSIYCIDISNDKYILIDKLTGYDSTIYNLKNGFLVYNRDTEENNNRYSLKEYEIKNYNRIIIKNTLLNIYDNNKFGLFGLIIKDKNNVIILDKYGTINIWSYQ